MSNLDAMMTPTMMIRQGMGPRQIVELILKGMEGTVFTPRTPHTSTDCCSDARALAVLKLIPTAEIEDTLKRETKVSCYLLLSHITHSHHLTHSFLTDRCEV